MSTRRTFLTATVASVVFGATAGCSGTSDTKTPTPTDDVPDVEFDYEGAPGDRYTITHQGGDAFVNGHVHIVYSRSDGSMTAESWGGSGDVVYISGNYTTARPVEGGSSIRVVWRPAGTDGEVFDTYEVPHS